MFNGYFAFGRNTPLLKISFMYRVLLLIIILLAFVFESCRETARESSAVSDTLVYETYSAEENLVTVVFEKSSGIVSRQKLFLKVIVTNKSDRTLNLSPSQWELETNEGSRSLPVSFENKKSKLLRDETDTVFISFEPITSRRLYQETGMRGDLDRNYTLAIRLDDPDQIVRQTVKLEAKEEFYKTSIGAYGLNATTTLFTLSGLSADESLSTFSNISNTISDRPVVSENGNEILSQGFWTKFSILHRDDTLLVSVRIVNQSASSVNIDINNIKLLAGDGSIISPKEKRPQIIKLQRGDRISLSLHFPVLIQHSYSLDVNGITFGEIPLKAVFGPRVNFTTYKPE
jgi:hypothetical protein